MRLKKDFFKEKDSLTLAKELLGKVLVRVDDEGNRLSGIISETEAYTQDEESCHAFNGKVTERTKVMFREAGHLYVYFTYGMHYCSNIVSEEEGRGCAVLIRAVEPYEGVDKMIENRNWYNKKLSELSNGPAKLCRALNIDKDQNDIDLTNKNSQVYLENLGFIPSEIKNTTRIGISKAQDLEWRFVVEKWKS